MKNPRTTFMMGIGLGVVLGAVFTAAGVWWLGFATLWTTSGTPGGSPSSPSPRPGSTTPPAGTPSAPPPGGNDLILSFSEVYLNRQMRAFLPADGPLERDARLTVDEGAIIVIEGRIRVTLGPITVPIPARLRIPARARDGRLALTLERVEVGPVPVPDNLIPETARTTLPKLEMELNRLLLENDAMRGMRVQVVRSERGRLVMELDDGE